MSSVSFLNEIKRFLEEKVSPSIRLQAPSDDDVYRYDLVNPSVFIGWVPPKGMIPEGIKTPFPCMIVGLDDGEAEKEKKTYAIRISVAVYSPGLHKIENGQMTYSPDFNGYVDLLNLIDRTVNILMKEGVTHFEMSENVAWGIYQQEQPYPYWYGFITFKASEKVVSVYKKYLE
jgi:hypothetical protein